MNDTRREQIRAIEAVLRAELAKIKDLQGREPILEADAELRRAATRLESVLEYLGRARLIYRGSGSIVYRSWRKAS